MRTPRNTRALATVQQRPSGQLQHAEVQCQRASPGCAGNTAVNQEMAVTAPQAFVKQVLMMRHASFPDRCRAKTGKGAPMCISWMRMSAIATDVQPKHARITRKNKDQRKRVVVYISGRSDWETRNIWMRMSAIAVHMPVSPERTRTNGSAYYSTYLPTTFRQH